jgi:pyridoxine/pyridoxamine 5'-phosphate oxidase
MDHGETRTKERVGLGEIAKRIIAQNRYLTLATVNAQGHPWASPVYFSTYGYAEFYWMSQNDALHSQNLKIHPSVAMVIFDTQQPVGTGQAVYISAQAEELSPPSDERALLVYPGPAKRGGRAIKLEQIRRPSHYRIYHASAINCSILCPRTAGPCEAHGKDYDHRISIALQDLK